MSLSDLPNKKHNRRNIMLVVHVDIFDDKKQVIRKEFVDYEEFKYWIDRRRSRTKLERCRVIAVSGGEWDR